MRGHLTGLAGRLRAIHEDLEAEVARQQRRWHGEFVDYADAVRYHTAWRSRATRR